MTVWTTDAPIPETVVPGGTTITFEAIDPTTGSAVGGVNVSNVAVYGYNVSASQLDIQDVIPAYTSDTSGTV